MKVYLDEWCYDCGAWSIKESGDISIEMTEDEKAFCLKALADYVAAGDSIKSKRPQYIAPITDPMQGWEKRSTNGSEFYLKK